MALETAIYISQLVATNPVVGDPVGQGDDHLRLLKTVLQAQFPNFTAAALSATNAQIDATVNTAKGTSGVFSVPLGSVSAPSYSFTGDSNTGIWSNGADQIDVSCGGSTIVAISTAGLEVVGGIVADATLTALAAFNCTGTATFSTPLAGTNLATNSVTTIKIADLNVTAAKIANATITTTQISSSAGITGAQLSSSAAIAITQLATDASHKAYVFGYGQTGTPTPVPAGGYVVHVREEQNSGTGGQSATLTAGSWSKRVLNTASTNEVTGASLATSVLVLPAGTYEVQGFCEGYVDSGVAAAAGLKARLRDTTNSATLIVGSNDYTLNVNHGSGATSQGVTLKSIVTGRFTLSGSTNIELQHYPVTASLASAGIALSTGEKEVYAELFIRLVKI